LRDYGLVDLSSPHAWSHGMGNWARAYSFHGPDHADLSFLQYRLGLALELPSPWAAVLNRLIASIAAATAAATIVAY
jgi:hypothetical protein